MNKKFRVEINGIEREKGTFTDKQIKNKLRQKWLDSAIKNTDKLSIFIFNPSYIDRWQPGGWSVQYKGDNKIIRCKSVDGRVNTYDINEIIKERESKAKGEQIDLYETIIEQSKLLFLSGSFKDYKCAFNHLVNRVEHEKRKKEEEQQKTVVRKR
jgi:hypothetical protein